MPRRFILTERQRSTLFDLLTDEATILHHYTLADDDIKHIHTRRHSRNRLVGSYTTQTCRAVGASGAHISPLGWAHIFLTGEYRWKNRSRNAL